MFEKRWAAVPSQSFTSNGTVNGVITVIDSSLFKVKQQVNITATSLPNLNLEIKSIPNDLTIVVGLPSTNIFTYTDVSAYTTALSAAINAFEQKRSSVPVEEINRAVYEEEPTVALRTIGVDQMGVPYSSTNPMPVDAIVTVGAVDVALTHLSNFPDPGDVADSVRIGDGVEELAINPDGSINSIKQNALVVTKFDDIVITRNSRNQAVLIEYKKLGVTTATATITRNSAGSIIRVLRTPSV